MNNGGLQRAAMRRITGIIFSDLGQASSFMAVNWVQEALRQTLGFSPYPATLNVRPKAAEDARLWEATQKESNGIPLRAADGGFCSARLYRITVQVAGNSTNNAVKGAILLPEVADYPKDKIEVIAPVRLKEAFGIQDGDQLTLELIG
jgi:CTP-dependent riboflavin kinase